MNKVLLGIVIGVVIAAGGYYYVTKYMPLGGGDLMTPQPLREADLSWRVEKAPNWEETMPYEIVYIVSGHSSKKVGESIGCDITTNAPLEQNEVMRKSCWFGGGGDDYSVFKDTSVNGGFVLKHRTTQEVPPGIDASPQSKWELLFHL